MDLDEMLMKSTAELESAEADLLAAQQRVDELRTIQEGIRLAKNRYGEAQPAPQNQSERLAAAETGLSNSKPGAGTSRRRRGRPARRGHPQVSQSEICLKLLADLARPVSSAEVRELLVEQGHAYDAEQIRSAFAYLFRKGKVVRVEPGVWELPQQQNKGSEAPASYREVTPLRQAAQ